MLNVLFQRSYFVIKCLQKPLSENSPLKISLQTSWHEKWGTYSYFLLMARGKAVIDPKASLDAPLHHWEQRGCMSAILPSSVPHKSQTKDQTNCCWRSAADVYLGRLENSLNIIAFYSTAHSCYGMIVNISTFMHKCLVCYNLCLRRCY